ncbi:hypothetical protein N7466_006879 [Penicillium verhagenii]|uniref:uncharacterized protein n=1 Tax=Penicillium verhagenii TaxID=1562060 RepID=UPI0025453EAF|nr:uncharacterized protein N7466_006879 [Penicillium verhagenii]KAJ5927923.1 hypothetical protein N7466_006879 [Penicillium verhagenii]
MAPLTRIDVHHHYFPSSLMKEWKGTSDWPMPNNNEKWTPAVSIAAMDKLGIQKAILSAPNSTDSAHDVNLDASKIVAQHPDRFGFFATLPLGNASMDVILEELRFALDDLKADGIAMVSSYGVGPDAKYVGHDDFEPLWQALHERKAIVFLHGDQTKHANAPPGNVLPIPIVEVPNETYKAAASLVTSGKKRKYSGAKIILSHSGGSTPFLACRAAVLANYVGNTLFGTSLTIDELLEDFKSFYYETALSGYDVNLAALQKFVAQDHILFGTDFPAVTVDMARWFTENLDGYFANDQSSHTAVMTENWKRLQN